MPRSRYCFTYSRKNLCMCPRGSQCRLFLPQRCLPVQSCPEQQQAHAARRRPRGSRASAQDRGEGRAPGDAKQVLRESETFTTCSGCKVS